MKEFCIFKATEKNNDKSPDYKITAKVGDKFVPIGAGWNRKTKGVPAVSFISCKLSNPFKDFKGFHLEEDENPTAKLPVESHQEPTAEEDFIAM
jgi:uncharacterized protein (DUF736 family)